MTLGLNPPQRAEGTFGDFKEWRLLGLQALSFCYGEVRAREANKGPGTGISIVGTLGTKRTRDEYLEIYSMRWPVGITCPFSRVLHTVDNGWIPAGTTLAATFSVIFFLGDIVKYFEAFPRVLPARSHLTALNRQSAHFIA